jgi:hypothetical protein
MVKRSVDLYGTVLVLEEFGNVQLTVLMLCLEYLRLRQHYEASRACPESR